MAGKHDTSKYLVTEKVIVQDLLNACPQAEAILKSYMGSGVLCIPGAKTESIEFLAAMHDTHVHDMLDEINQICKIPPKKAGHF